VIAFGTAITDSDEYRRHAQPGIRRTVEPDSEVYPFQAVGAVGRSNNLILDHAAESKELEALVLVDEKAEISDPDFCEKVRRAIGDPEVGAVGAVGATGGRSIAWWEGSVSCGAVTQRYPDYEGGEMPAFSWTERAPAPAEVEALDGLLLVLSPWAVRNVRFDEALSLGHGYEVDYCMQLRSAGKQVTTADFGVIHHRPLKVVDDLKLWAEAHIQLAEKWDDRLGGEHPDSDAWKQRARRAEAEREAAQTMAYSAASTLDAQLAPLERELAEATGTLAWRLTQPLRQANQWRRSRAGRRDSGGPR